jgi:hypothetical protein
MRRSFNLSNALSAPIILILSVRVVKITNGIRSNIVRVGGSGWSATQATAEGGAVKSSNLERVMADALITPFIPFSRYITAKNVLPIQ